MLYIVDKSLFPLDRREVRGVVRRLPGHRIRQPLACSLHERCQGWAAGLVLLVDHLKGGLGTCSAAGLSLPSSVHGYFMREVWSCLDDRVRTFMMKTSVCPFFTVEIACRLTGDGRARQFLEMLHRNNFFVEYSAEEGTYRYHGMFREFLVELMKDRLPEDERIELQSAAALALKEAGYSEQAALLYVDMRDWRSLSRLILADARSLLRRDRRDDLFSWLMAMPESWLSDHPWLEYWAGRCLLGKSPDEARARFVSAFEGFEIAGDQTGRFLAWVSIVEAALIDWDFSFLRSWLGRMEREILDSDGFPGREIESKVVLAMFSSMMFLEPWHERIVPWLNRLESCLHDSQDDDYRMRCGPPLVSYYQWVGRVDELVSLVGILRPLGGDVVRPSALVDWYLSEAIVSWFIADWEQCSASIAKGMEAVVHAGAPGMAPLFSIQGVYCALSRGDMDEGEVHLERIKAAIDSGHRMHRAHYYYLLAWQDDLLGRPARSVHHLHVALRIARADGTPFPLACVQVELAGLLVEQGDLDDAWFHLQAATETARRVRASALMVKCLLVRASLEDRRDDRRSSDQFRREAFSLANRHGIVNLPWWNPRSMATHCVRALESGIEAEYVRGLIRARTLVPDRAPVHLEDWPWLLKIYTLGRFSLVREGRQVELRGKGQHMPLTLLKTLIAMGARDVPESALSEALWPSSEVESAHSNFTTTLSRLRRLLGDPRILRLCDGHLSIDSRLCWVDVWAFERSSNRADRLWRACSGDPGKDFVFAAMQALECYKGGFLGRDGDEEYAIFSARERMREKHLWLVMRLGEWYRRHGRVADAAACYEKALEVDDQEEEVYRRLMACYAEMGHRSRAVRLYRRCQKILRIRLNIMPGPETVEIYHGLLDD